MSVNLTPSRLQLMVPYIELGPGVAHDFKCPYSCGSTRRLQDVVCTGDHRLVGAPWDTVTAEIRCRECSRSFTVYLRPDEVRGR